VYGDKAVALWLGATQKARFKADTDGSGLHFASRPGPRRRRAFHGRGAQGAAMDNGKPGVRADYGRGYLCRLRHRTPDGYRHRAYCGK